VEETHLGQYASILEILGASNDVSRKQVENKLDVDWVLFAEDKIPANTARYKVVPLRLRSENPSEQNYCEFVQSDVERETRTMLESILNNLSQLGEKGLSAE